MRSTPLVLAFVAATGGLAFWYSAGGEDAPPSESGRPEAPLQRPSEDVPPGPPKAGIEGQAPQAAQDALDAEATRLVGEIELARKAGDGAGAERAEALLRQRAWDAPAARRHAMREGLALLSGEMPAGGRQAIERKDRARRLLSRGLDLPEHFGADGAPTTDRQRLVDAIQKLNRQVMRYAPGLPGVTAPYEVPQGAAPVLIVSRQRLPMGPNALLLWNVGSLDPNRLHAGDTILLPQEELTLHVSLPRRRLGVYIGDWFVKEFRVGVGKPDSPTPVGGFSVLDRQFNPPWTAPDGRVLPYGHPDNELGDAWISIVNDEYPRGAGYGLHGTNKPDTVGERSSNGCVRLVNEEAKELVGWVRRQDSNGGAATRVFIR